MHDPLQRLYRTKLVLLATLLLFTGLSLLILAHWLAHSSGRQWLANLPVSDIGSGLFTTGLLSVALQYFDGQDSEVRATERLEHVLTAAAPAMRDAVIDGFAFEPEDLGRVATPDTLDKIIINGLALRLNDASFAQDIYDDLRSQAIGIPERLNDARISIRLSPAPAHPGSRAPMFVTTVRWEFTLVPIYPTRRFLCLSDAQEFRDLDQDTVATSAWFLPPQAGVDAGARESFELVDFSVNGEHRTIRRAAKAGSQTYTVNLGKEAMEAGEPVTVAYTYRTITAVRGHLLQLRVDQPTHGLSVELDYTGCGIANVRALDFIASSTPTRVSYHAADLPGQLLSVDFDGWVFPRSGVAFVWTLDDDHLR